MDSLEHMLVTDDWQLVAHRSTKETVGDLIDLYDRLNDCYATYENSISTFATCPAVSPLSIEKDILIDFYEAPPTALKKLLRIRRNDHQLYTCPYCGTPKKPNELDHFIPKGEWPEYSIYPNNLVPQCDGCARIKSVHYFCDQNHAAFFLHPMYTNLLVNIYFSVQIHFIDDLTPPLFTPEFTVDHVSTIERQRIERHLNKLNVAERFIAFCESEFIIWKNMKRRASFTIESAMAQRIQEKSPDGVSAKDWGTAFYIAVLANIAVVDYFNRIQRPVRTVSQPVARMVLNVS
ncbi:HNH endonuclease [Pseudomonas koreensis]|jgi:hypothetical protein|uniref:HNH endonuclease n=1 Tax=Pseudomonas koreensis TaxID=198620 RepID=UPI0010BF9090|nr:HNH endonuclease [Pseudomonas koreensis]TKJ86794.1 HNH endonuclease [Pseudomonas koreensis]